jgi:hypothetical protein
MINNEQEYIEVAMKAYDNPSCITIDEFKKDLNQYIIIKKAIRRYFVDPSSLRKTINHVIIYYNCFGIAGTDLLLYKTHEEDILSVLIPIILYLGRGTPCLDNISVTLNIDVIKHLAEI